MPLIRTVTALTKANPAQAGLGVLVLLAALGVSADAAAQDGAAALGPGVPEALAGNPWALVVGAAVVVGGQVAAAWKEHLAGHKARADALGDQEPGAEGQVEAPGSGRSGRNLRRELEPTGPQLPQAGGPTWWPGEAPRPRLPSRTTGRPAPQPPTGTQPKGRDRSRPFARLQASSPRGPGAGWCRGGPPAAPTRGPGWRAARRRTAAHQRGQGPAPTHEHHVWGLRGRRGWAWRS